MKHGFAPNDFSFTVMQFERIFYTNVDKIVHCPPTPTIWRDISPFLSNINPTHLHFLSSLRVKITKQKSQGSALLIHLGLKKYTPSSPTMGKDADTITRTLIQVKWYHTFVLLVGTILSVVDPITDVLTLMEFHRNNHKTWFGVGLFFVILPSLFFSVLYCRQLMKTDDKRPGLVELLICGCNPFSVAFTRLRAFILCSKNFKKLWHREDLDADLYNKIRDLMYYATWTGMFEAILESAPQFIIQLYAIIVQQEQVAIFQIISLCVSVLSLAWTSLVADEWRLLTCLSELESQKTDLVDTISSVKFKAALYVSQLFHLASRLLAITFFTVRFTWWIIAMIIMHSIFMAVTRCIADCMTGRFGGCAKNCYTLPTVLYFYWIRDDGSAGVTVDEKGRTLKIIQLVSNLLFVIENVLMIWVYYSHEQTHSWYSKPVVVCVCLFSVLGAVIRVVLYRFLL